MKAAASALTRRQLFESGGALVVMFALTGCGGDESTAPARFADQQTGAWLRIDENGAVTVFTGKAELGQGIRAALAQIAADELDVPYHRMTVITADTALTPDEGYTFGSLSVQRSGSAVRRAAAQARLSLRELAAARWKVPLAKVSAANGELSDGRRTLSYGAVVTGAVYERTVTDEAPQKDPANYRYVGLPLPRPDIPDKVFGAESYLQDLRLPGMAFGRIIRPPRFGAALVSVETALVEGMAGVLKIVRDGSFLGVIAAREEIAEKAAIQLRQNARWSDGEAITIARDISALVRSFDQDVTTLKSSPEVREGDETARAFSAAYERPFQAHASMAPSAAVALWERGRLHLWTHSQGVYPLRDALAEAFRIPEESIRVSHRDGAGCYGHNGADDAAMDAAMLAMAAPGIPVKLQWSREDEFQWEPYGPAMLMEVEARLDQSGRIAAWTYDVSGFAHSNRPGGAPGNLIAAQTRTNAIAPPEPLNIPQPTGGLDRNAIPLYDLPGQSIRERFIKARPVRTSSLRALGAYGNVFAIESFMDELAAASGQDPVKFRLDHLSDERARKVMSTLAEAGNWPTDSSSGNDWRGRGVAFARYKNLGAYYAAIADVTVNPADGEIALEHIIGVVDCGLVVNPDGARNQIEGGAIQSASWTLLEQATFEDGRSSARDWLSYPILTFDRIPEIETVFVERKNEPSVGVGEASQGPIAAAIANAVFAAAGIRLRRIPLTPARVLAALSEKQNREG